MKYLYMTLAVLAIWLCDLPAALADPTDTIPPEILKQFDKDILSGKRPTFASIKKEDIFGLRQKPKKDADLVFLSFNVSELSTVQREIVAKWLRSGSNRILLRGADIEKYRGLLDIRNDLLRQEGTKSYDKVLVPYEKHPVFTDCTAVFARNDSSTSSGRKRRYYWHGLAPGGADNLIEGARYDGTSLVAAGAFTVGQTRLYFLPKYPDRGNDAARWNLNFYHWLMGLKIPGAADTNIGGGQGGGVTSLAEAEKLDAITFRNGDGASGTVLDEKFTVKTSYADLDFATDKIAKIVFEGAGANVDMVTLKAGDQFSGVVQNETITVRLVTDAEVRVSKEKIKEIVFRAKR